MKNQDLHKNLEESQYKYGFVSNLEQEIFEKGLSEDIIKRISKKKDEPSWVLDFRLKAFRDWSKMKEPKWSQLSYNPIDYQGISYFAEPKKKPKIDSLEDLDPEIKRTFDKLGIPLEEQKVLAGVAVDVVLDSVSVATTFKKKLTELGIIFCPISEAIAKYPKLVKQYLGSVVPARDNFFACLNSAVFTDGTFCYVPRGVKCPIEVSTYFRINAQNTGQFERTLIIAEDDSYVSYLEGCTAPERKENQLHAAVVELITHSNAEIKYSTVQNWYPGNEEGGGGVYNFVTKRGLCKGNHSKISWTQVETGSSITWKYPSVILKGDNTTGEFYSMAVTNNYQQADTGTKMIHIGKNTKSRIISKSIAAKKSSNTYRGLVKIVSGADGAKNYSSCDSLLFGPKCKTNTYPFLESSNPESQVEHEASTSKIDEDILFYCKQRGLTEEESTNLIVNGFSKEIIQKLPMEFAVEAGKLLAISLEGSVG